MALFKSILDDQRSLPKDQPYKDLVQIIAFILRRFFKALEEEPFLAIEVRHSCLQLEHTRFELLIEARLGAVPYEPRTLETVLKLGAGTEA